MCWDKIWAQVTDLGGAKNPSRKMIQGRKAVNKGYIHSSAIRAGKQSSVLRGALENRVRHIPQNASTEGERAGALIHQIQGAWVEGYSLDLLIFHTSETSLHVSWGFFHNSGQKAQAHAYRDGQFEVGWNELIWGMCLGHWQCSQPTYGSR